MKEYCRHYALAIMVVGALVFAAPLAALAGHVNGSGTTGHASATDRRAEDVRATIHNLSSTNLIVGTNIGSGSSATTEVCVFCHTPHGANTSAPGAAPLWNRAIPTTAGYTMYNSPNFEETSLAPVGVSLACLSCHDGTIALDALVNAPGSGGFRSANLPAGGSSSIGLISNAAGANFLDAGNKMDPNQRTDTGSNYDTITGGAVPFPNLTQNLTDDHPISFEFPNGAGANTDPQFTDRTVTQVGSIGTVSSPNLNTPVDKRDAIRMYPPGGANDWDVSSPGWVECASCHNPHAPRPLVLRLPNQPTSLISGGGPGGASSFADDPNQGSAVCLTCHDK